MTAQISSMSAGNLFALAGWILFGFAFFLGIRIPYVIRLFGGLARLHRLHHWIGLASAGSLCAHAAFEIASDSESALAVLDDPLLLSGWIGLVLLLCATGFALSSLSHRIWIALHWTLAAAWTAGLLHALAFRLSGFHTAAVIAGAALAALSIAAALVLRLVYTTWTVAAARDLGQGLTEIELLPPRFHRRTFKAGSIVFARFRGKSFSHAWHPFSVASCRFEPALRLLVRAAGSDTAHAGELAPGEPVDLAGPFAEFGETAHDQVWIAGGVGIAPFLGMIHCLDFTRTGRIKLIVYQKAETPSIRKQLDAFASRHAGFSFSAITSARPPDDFHESLDAAKDMHAPQFLVCGPPVFMKAVRRYLVAKGIPRRQISTEEFTPW